MTSSSAILVLVLVTLATATASGEKLTNGLRAKAQEARAHKCRDHVVELADQAYRRLLVAVDEGFEGFSLPFPLNQSRCRGQYDVLAALAKALCGNESLSVFVKCQTPPPLETPGEDGGDLLVQPPTEMRVWPVTIGLQPEAPDEAVGCDCHLPEGEPK
jgi:hypothetical protein